MSNSESIDNLSIYFGTRQALVEFELERQTQSSCEVYMHQQQAGISKKQSDR